MSVPRLEIAKATLGLRSTAGTRFRRRVQVTQNRPSWKTKFMITPTGSPAVVVHMKVHSVCLESSTASRSSSRWNFDTSS
ncbi:uncharacterized protein METZ01_LOCUS4462 [marine metagenome]|uniref:Uncharacterized protein n=1 Tax=marine metagenome TaxID=408172 RepID=A0A381NCV0_9ZZZZ